MTTPWPQSMESDCLSMWCNGTELKHMARYLTSTYGRKISAAAICGKAHRKNWPVRAHERLGGPMRKAALAPSPFAFSAAPEASERANPPANFVEILPWRGNTYFHTPSSKPRSLFKPRRSFRKQARAFLRWRVEQQTKPTIIVRTGEDNSAGLRF